MSINNIFNRKNLRVHRNRAVKHAHNSLFFQNGADDIIECLNILDRDFYNILDVGCRTGYLTKILSQQYKNAYIVSTDISESMLQSFNYDQKLLIDEEELDFAAGTIDLITFSLGLHWINDIESFFLRIRYILKPNGIFIANFIGGSSLKKLRIRLINAEIKSNRTHFSHIPPFIHFEHITPLLQGAGFVDIIVDHKNIDLEYNSPLDLMKEIRNIGESNILTKTFNYTISKKMILDLNDNTSTFSDHVNIISFIASPSKGSIKLKL